jgi:cell division protein FtsL
MFAMIIAPGIVLGYTEYLASNTGAYGIASASCVATVGSVLIIVSAAQSYLKGEMQNCIGEKVVCTAMCIFIAALIASLAYYRVTALYGGEKINALESTIETGPSKGLKVSVQYSEMYEKVLSDTERIRSMPTDTKVAFMGNSFLWMAGEQRCGAYTTYIMQINPLKKYYEIQPDKIADIIYVQDGYEKNMVQELAEAYGYEITRVSSGWLLEMK